MTKFSALKVLALMAGLFLGGVQAASASETGNLQASGADLTDRGSLQRGAKYYMNYCAGCHSLKHMRYNRLAEDLGLSEKDVQEQLNLTGGQFGDHIISSMTPDMAKAAFNKVPPDLSLISRVRGDDWVYTYLKSFYLDETRPVGWNNTLFPGASMPNPLWSLQGVQQPVYGKADATGERPVERLELAHEGSLKPREFDQVARDITTFLAYTGEPAVLKRPALGVWVLLFLAIFTLLAWLLKNEYWKDVH